MSALPGVALGGLAGRLLFSSLRKTKAAVVIAEILFAACCGLYLCKGFIAHETNPLLELLKINEYGLFACCFLVVFLSAVKFSYFLKASCGDFIDEKPAANFFIFICFAGSAAGTVLSAVIPLADSLAATVVLLVAVGFCIVTSFFIGLEYSPDIKYAQIFTDEEGKPVTPAESRDDMFFTYMNIAYIFIYIYLGYVSYVKFYGDMQQQSVLFAVAASLFIAAGFAIGRVTPKLFWHIYSEMLFPVLFLLYIFLMYKFAPQTSLYKAVFFFAPAGIFFGFALHQTIKTITTKFNHSERYNILFFSAFIIPVPILIALSFIEFTYLWYFIIVYALAAVNIIIPGLYMMNRSIGGFRRYLFFTLALLSLPFILFMHLSLRIPVNQNLYITKCKNFKEIQNTNYNSPYIKSISTITINGSAAFKLSDDVIRSLKRSLLPVFMYHPAEENILFIDGNQKFFPNPSIALFANATVADTTPAGAVDFQRLPIAGKPAYVAEEKSTFKAVDANKKYRTIVDMPNLLDLSSDSFRFSAEYAEYIKEHLDENGMFAEIFDLRQCKAKTLADMLQNIKRLYKRQLVWLFPNTAVILASNAEAAFEVTPKIFANAANLVSDKKAADMLFYNTGHFLSNMISADAAALLPFPYADDAECITDNLKQSYIKRNDFVLSLMTQPNPFFANSTARDAGIFTRLKQASLAESEQRYVDEMEAFFELRRLAEYNIELAPYIKFVLSYKKEYYYSAALLLEQEKDWETAKKLYEAIITIDKENFNANYRLGMLSLTIQDLDASFRYLQQALKIRQDDPKALTQMGILLFSAGRTDEAVQYLNNALGQREYTKPVFFYLGLSYEALGRLNEAKEYLLKASREDPNDKAVQTSLQEIEAKIQAEADKWKIDSPQNEQESEKGENIPLPVNESAIEQRMDNGKEIQGP